MPPFERQLRQNIEAMSGRKVHSTRGRLLMEYFPEHQQLRLVFGLASYSPALQVEKEMEAIKKAALALVRSLPRTFPATFKVETTRSDKTFPLTSLQMNILLGKHIEQETNLQADYKSHKNQKNSSSATNTVFLEINQVGAFLYTEVISGPGGLPVGSSGMVSLLMENDASILAGLLMMKRGCRIVPTYVDASGTLEKKLDLSLLQKFSPQALSSTVLKDKEELSAFIEQQDLTLVTGEVLGNEKVLEKGGEQADFVTLKPLIAYTGEEIRVRLSLFQELTF